MATTIIDHPLITHKLAIMRDKDTSDKEFCENLKEIAQLASYVITKDLPVKEVEIQTPLCTMKTTKLAQPVILVPILRAGLGFLEGMKSILPNASVGHIGMKRDEESLIAHEYYANFPDNLKDSIVIVLDPMLATGSSSSQAIENIKKRGAKKIKFFSLVAAPKGVEVIETQHPDVDLYICALDEKLNEKGYIVPGLGDAGDRIFGTK